MTRLYVFAGIFLILALAFGAQHLRLRAAKADAVRARAELADFQAATAKAATEKLLENERIYQEQERKNKEIKETYGKRLASVRARYAERLRDYENSSRSGPVPEASGTTGEPDAATAERRFAEALGRCEEDRQRLISLQDWVREWTSKPR